jgi:hypothetical protein
MAYRVRVNIPDIDEGRWFTVNSFNLGHHRTISPISGLTGEGSEGELHFVMEFSANPIIELNRRYFAGVHLEHVFAELISPPRITVRYQFTNIHITGVQVTGSGPDQLVFVDMLFKGWEFLPY